MIDDTLTENLLGEEYFWSAYLNRTLFHRGLQRDSDLLVVLDIYSSWLIYSSSLVNK